MARRMPAGILGVLLLLGGLGLMLFSIAEGVYYPFWAAHASRAALARSWGGPSPVRATVVHWLVGLLPAAVGFGLFRVGWRLCRPRRRVFQQVSDARRDR